MKKQYVWMLVAIMTLCGIVTLTSCADNGDNPVVIPDSPGPLADKLEGMWSANYDAQGTVPDPTAEGGKVAYTKVMHAYEFFSDGTGLWEKFFINEEGAPVDNFGDLIYDKDTDLLLADGFFHYTSTDDGTIYITLAHPDVFEPEDNIPTSWELHYLNGSISGNDGTASYTMTLADEETKADIMAYAKAMHGGLNAENPNELDQDVSGVKYTILSDVTKVKGQVLANILKKPKNDPFTEAAIEVINEKTGDANTRSLLGHTTWIPSGFRTVDYTYESIDEQGKPVTLSARAVWGVFILLGKEIRPDYIVLAPHLTIADDLSCPTNGANIENLFMKGDKLLILPDYLGFGVSKDRVQPYINHELCARNSIDALKAGYKVFRDLTKAPLEDDWKLYVAGPSQGGANALAIHRWLDEHDDFATRWRFAYSYCGSGPYSPPITFEKYYEQQILVYPVVMPLVIKAMLAAYPDILGKWKEEDFYSESYLAHKDAIDLMVNSKDYTAGEINNYIFGIYPHKGEKDINGGKEIWMSDMLSDKALDRESEMNKAFFKCLEKNDLTKGWTPKRPIHLYHGRHDKIVNYANAEAVMAAFPDMATLTNAPLVTDGHIGSCVDWLLTITFGLW